MTLKEEARAEIKVQGSRFVATAVPCTTREAAEEFIAALKKKYFDATHNCYAYRVGPAGDIFRSNDDGEPPGSAGKPILSAMDKFKVTNVVVVVTRYFGGTKLGVGGLVRAYGGAASSAIEAGTITKELILASLLVSFPHSRVSEVMHAVSSMGSRILDTQYDEEVHLTIAVRLSMAESLKSLLIQRTRGNVEIREKD